MIVGEGDYSRKVFEKSHVIRGREREKQQQLIRRESFNLKGRGG